MCGVNLVNSITPPPTHLLKSVRNGWSTKRNGGRQKQMEREGNGSKRQQREEDNQYVPKKQAGKMRREGYLLHLSV